MTRKCPCDFCDMYGKCNDPQEKEYVIVTYHDNRYKHCKQKVFDNYVSFFKWYTRYVCKRKDVYFSGLSIDFVRCEKEVQRLHIAEGVDFI